MRRLIFLTLFLLAGCRNCPVEVPLSVEAHVAAVAQVRSAPELVPSLGSVPPPETVDLPSFWNLTLANNPSLREAAAALEAARGRFIQATKYPNPQVTYSQENIGTSKDAIGATRVEITQEILTASKRPLDLAIAARGADTASLALLGRKFEVLTHVRRAYYEYVGSVEIVRASTEIVATFEEDVKNTRRLVEELKTRPRRDLVRIEAMLEEAQINLARSQVNQEAAWRELAAQVGVPQLPMPSAASDLPEKPPKWDANLIVQRVLAANTELKQATVRAEQARLQIDRAKADAVPNITVGSGYGRNFADPEAETGAIISLQAPLPLWDRKQGRIHEAEAQWAQTQAAVGSTALRLTQQTAAAFGRYEADRQQVERLVKAVVPRLSNSVELMRKGYQAGGADVTFVDLLLAEQSLNTARLTLAEARRDWWLAIADLQNQMQLDLSEELAPLTPTPLPRSGGEGLPPESAGTP